MADQACFDGHPAGPQARDQIRPDRRQVVGRVLDACAGSLGRGLQPVSTVGQDHDLLGRHQEAARVAGHLVLAIVECETGQVAHVLGSNTKVRVYPSFGHAIAQSSQAYRPGCRISLRPAGAVGVARRCLEVGGMRQTPDQSCHGFMVAALPTGATSTATAASPR